MPASVPDQAEGDRDAPMLEPSAAPEAADHGRIEALVEEQLRGTLEIIPEHDFITALHDFVEKACLLCLILHSSPFLLWVAGLSILPPVSFCHQKGTGKLGTMGPFEKLLCQPPCKSPRVAKHLAGRINWRSPESVPSLPQDEKQALADCVQRALEATQKLAISRTGGGGGAEEGDVDVEAVLREQLEERRRAEVRARVPFSAHICFTV